MAGPLSGVSDVVPDTDSVTPTSAQDAAYNLGFFNVALQIYQGGQRDQDRFSQELQRQLNGR